MKKLITLVFALFATTMAFAQTEVGSFFIMPKAGLNVSRITNWDIEPKNRVAFVGGIEAGHQLNSWLGLSVGVLYSQQGVKGNIFEADRTLKLDYVNVPIMANFYIVKGLALKTGVQIGFMTNHKLRYTEGNETKEKDLEAEWAEDSHYKGQLQKTDLSIPMGISYEFSNVVIDARYNLGLNTFVKNEVHEENVFNRVFQVTLGYKFSL